MKIFSELIEIFIKFMKTVILFIKSLIHIVTKEHAFLYPPSHSAGGYISACPMFVISLKKNLRPHKLYIFLIRMKRRVDLVPSVCPCVETQITPPKLNCSSFYAKLFIGILSSSSLKMSNIGQRVQKL